MKLKIYRDYFISMSGVELLWVYDCPDERCRALNIHKNHANFWHNILRSAHHHIAWHKQVRSAQV